MLNMAMMVNLAQQMVIVMILLAQTSRKHHNHTIGGVHNVPQHRLMPRFYLMTENQNLNYPLTYTLVI